MRYVLGETLQEYQEEIMEKDRPSVFLATSQTARDCLEQSGYVKRPAGNPNRPGAAIAPLRLSSYVSALRPWPDPPCGSISIHVPRAGDDHGGP